MSILTLRLLLLVIHISGLVLIAGSTVTRWMVFRAFVKSVATIRQESTSLLKILDGLGAMFRLGAIVLVLSGIGLMWITQGVYLHQLWLQIKLWLILLLPLTEVLVGNRQLKKLDTAFSEIDADVDSIVRAAVPKLNMSYAAQLLLFLAIISLAIFKIN